MAEPATSPATWVFLSNHAHVLLCIARDPDTRTRDIAEQVGITERTAQRIVSELVAEGYLKRTKTGRRNRYEVNRQGHLRSDAFRRLEIGPLLDLLETDHGAGRADPRTRAGVGERDRAYAVALTAPALFKAALRRDPLVRRAGEFGCESVFASEVAFAASEQLLLLARCSLLASLLRS